MAPSVCPPSNVRRKIVFMLVACSVLSYALRMNIAIAQQSMVRELGLNIFNARSGSCLRLGGRPCLGVAVRIHRIDSVTAGQRAAAPKQELVRQAMTKGIA